MKKWIATLLACALALGLCGAGMAEGVDFSLFCGNYYFSSGAGAWGTEITIAPDGSFYGNFHDWDGSAEYNGVHGDHGMMYVCEFTGQLTRLAQYDAYTFGSTVQRMELLSGDPDSWYFDDEGTLIVNSDPYGINQGDELRFYLPGTPTAGLSEEFLSWCLSLRFGDYDPSVLPFNCIYNLNGEYGFEWSSPYEGEMRSSQSSGGSNGGGFAFVTPQPALPQPTPQPAVREGLQFPISGVVVNCKQSVSLRAEPSTKATALTQVPLGAIVTLYSNTAWWDGKHYLVDAGYEGLRGYICIEYLDAILPGYLGGQTGYLQGAAGTVRITDPGNELIMRSGPGTGYENLGLLFGGEVLAYRGDARQDSKGLCWYHCSYYGSDCWISAKYTTLTLNDGRRFTGSRGIF